MAIEDIKNEFLQYGILTFDYRIISDQNIKNGVEIEIHSQNFVFIYKCELSFNSDIVKFKSETAVSLLNFTISLLNDNSHL